MQITKLNVVPTILGAILGFVSATFIFIQEEELKGYRDAIAKADTMLSSSDKSWTYKCCNQSAFKSLPPFTILFSAPNDSIVSQQLIGHAVQVVNTLVDEKLGWRVIDGLPNPGECVSFRILTAHGTKPHARLTPKFQDASAFYGARLWKLFRASPSWMQLLPLSLLESILIIGLAEVILRIITGEKIRKTAGVPPPNGD